MRRSPKEYKVPKSIQAQDVVYLSDYAPEVRLATILALIPLGEPLFTHLVPLETTARLVSEGIAVIPVLHNLANPKAGHDDYVELIKPRMAVAVSRAVAISHMDSTRCPITVLRHELTQQTLGDGMTDRNAVRSQLGISHSDLVIGMVGKHKGSKRYDLAIKAFGAYRKLSKRAVKLVIVGSLRRGTSNRALEKVRTALEEQDCGEHVLLIGGKRNARKYFPAFDVFLNTSSTEGLSIASLEAKMFGLPRVLSNVGGQKEIADERTVLVAADSGVDGFSDGMLIASKLEKGPFERLPSDRLPKFLWRWFAISQKFTPDASAGIIFITNNLNHGGAQRSLANLLRILPRDRPISCLLFGKVYNSYLQKMIEDNGIPLYSLHQERNIYSKIEVALAAINAMKIGQVVFWNLDARAKCAIAKSHLFTNLRLIDVSPGPQLSQSLDKTNSFCSRISFSVGEYLTRLNHIVVKYRSDPICIASASLGKDCSVIPNGVSRPLGAPSIFRDRRMFPNLPLSVLVLGRIVPNKHVLEVLDVASELRKIEPTATVDFVGRVEGEANLPYWNRVVRRVHELNLGSNVRFLGSTDDASAILQRYPVLLLLSKNQGCPNTSLEAMAAGVPVVANDDGGTSEQIRDGHNGYIVDVRTPGHTAACIAYLMRNPSIAERMGRNGQIIASSEFSMELMGERYSYLLSLVSPQINLS
jgi:glycosyltransferase involved in cell wall biosynthesis